MKSLVIQLHYVQHDDESTLLPYQQTLLREAKHALGLAYAPYSGFRVGAAALLANSAIVTGSNQENASSPAGLCAERTTLSVASSVHPGVPIRALAITAQADRLAVRRPVAPCGICRQSLLEVEERGQQPIEIILQGAEGPVYILRSARDLLPLSFGRHQLENP